jgi:citrate lyase subunit beta / citryl-CoA lyase
MHSLLIAPADERRLAEALESGAAAVIADLAAVAPAEGARARQSSAQWLQKARGRVDSLGLFVRVHALDSGETDADLDAIMPGAPAAIVLPASLGASSVQELSAKLALREAAHGLVDGATRIIAVADTAQSLLNMGSYRGSSARLAGVAWDAQALRRDLGAEADRDADGALLGPYRLARDLTITAAKAARVASIDASFPEVGNLAALRAEALDARRDGFAGKMAFDAAQVSVINQAFARQSE